MRAVCYDGSLRFDAKYPEPNAGEGECLIRVHLAGICGTDVQITSGYMNFRGVLGHEFVGTVEAGPPRWKSKRVACEINCVCRQCDMCQTGLANHCRNRTVIGISGRNGCFADRIAVPEQNLHEVPESVTDEEAVFTEPLAAAYQALAQCPVDARMRVSVVGSGRLGLLIAQLLRETKCSLTVIGRNRHKLLFAEKRGIQGITVQELVAQQDRDVVLECTGTPEGLKLAMELVRPRGTIVLKSTHAEAGSVNLSPIVVNEIRLLGSRCGSFAEAIRALARKAVDVQSMISRTFALEHAADAFEAATQPSNIKILLKINPR